MIFSATKTAKRLLSIFSLTGVLFCLLLLPGTAQPAGADEKKLWEALTYLKSVPEIGWMEIEGRNVVLGWEGYPAQFARMNKIAAKKASKRVRGEVRIYSVKAVMKGWRPAENAPPHLCHTEAKAGRLTFSNCR